MMTFFRFLLFISCFSYSIVGFSQTTNKIDSLSGYVKYHTKIQPSPSSDQLITINAFLDFNSRESFFIKNQLGMDSIAELGGMKHDSKKAFLTTPTHDETGYIVYRNFETQEIFFNYQKVGPLPAYKIQDNWMEMEWNIEEDTKIIAGHSAQKATTTFRGTDFTVWFANDIPLPYGPLKLFGLPGVILEVWYDKKQSIVAYEVCYPCKNINDIAPPPEALVRTIKEHVHIRDNFQYYLFLEMNKNSNGSFITMSESPTEKSILEKRKQSIEKIYEWENKKTKRLVQSSELQKMVTPKRKSNENTIPISNFPSQPNSVNTINQF